MSRFQKFIENERKNEQRKRITMIKIEIFLRKENVVIKRFIKPSKNRETFMKNMEKNKGATIQQFNILDAVKHKPKKEKKRKKEKKTTNNEFLNNAEKMNEDEERFMKEYVLKYYEEENDEEDENDEVIAINNSSNKDNDIISF